MRISIIGHSGSGKSTLAGAISQKLHIPHLHMDRLWFDAGGQTIKPNESTKREQAREYMRTKVREFVKQDAWVSDGWYRHIQPLIAERADRIVFLDIPLPRRLFNHLWRTFFEERHGELTRWDDIKFVYHIIRRTYIHGPGLRQFVKENAARTVVLKDYEETRQYLESI